MDGPPTIEDFAEAGFNPFTAAKTIGGEAKLTDPFTELARLRGPRSTSSRWPKRRRRPPPSRRPRV